MLEQGRSFSGRERNCCFLNVPNGPFATISAISGLDLPDDARAVAATDWDQDGDIDLWITNRNAPRLRLMRNSGDNAHHFLALKLQGDGQTTNRDAIGARVEIFGPGIEEHRLIRTLRAGEGFLSQSSKWMHIGLGDVEQIDKVAVHWPGGAVQEFDQLRVDCRYRLVQGSRQAIPLDASQRSLVLKPMQQPKLKSAGPIRVPLVTPLPMPRSVGYTDFDDAKQQLTFDGSSSPTLIVLWASWCLPCWGELKELAQRESELRSAGVEVVALCVDGLGDDRSDPQTAHDLCVQLKLPFTTGKADAEFVQLMTGYHQMLVAVKKQLPVPTSFLVDRQGRLSVIYKGRLDVDQLLADADGTPQTLVKRWIRAAGLPGRTIDHPALSRSLRRVQANILCAVGNALAKGGRFADATPYFQFALETEPEFGLARQGYAQVLQFTKQYADAVVQYKKAIAQDPQQAFLSLQLANVLVLQGKLDEAIASFAAAIRKNPDYWEAYVGRANVLVKRNRRAEAISDLQQALRINPGLDAARQMLFQLGQGQR